jgi:glycosyltransferase involved in cell wall biosynthesis
MTGIWGEIAGFLGEAQAPDASSLRCPSPPSSSHDVGGSGSQFPQILKPPPPGISSIKCSVEIVIFSKDRCFQLDMLIETFLKRVQLDDLSRYRISVLYLSTSPEMEEAYRCDLGSKYDGRVSLVREDTSAGGFINQLQEILKDDDDAEEDEFRSVLFLVDDMVFFDDFNLTKAVHALHQCPSLFSFHLKLHPGITYCHASGKSCHRPRFWLPREQILGFDADILNFRRSDGTGDWDYPWDLTGGLYRIEEARAVIKCIREHWGENGGSNPNLLEFHGAKLLSLGSTCISMQSPFSSCPGKALCASLAVNRVQSEFETPIFDSRACSVGAFLCRFVSGSTTELNSDWYQSQQFSSVHIGDLKLRPSFDSSDHPVADLITNPPVSVILPFHDAAKFIREAVSSVFAQSLQDFELVLVDDASTDKGLESITDMLADRRVVVVQLCTHIGLSGALNAGIAAASGSLIARMDADDVMLPQRLEKQLRFLSAPENARVLVLGSGAVSFAEERVQRVIVQPVEPLMVQWSLLFSCCIIHPTVMARRCVFKAGGGYKDDAFPTEDYDMWLRMPPRSVANLGEPLLLLRKHASSISTTRRSEQRNSSMHVAVAALQRLLQRDVSETHVATLRAPELAASADDAIGAAHLLVDSMNVMLSQCDDDSMMARHLIHEDMKSRLGALAVQSLATFGVEASPLVKFWSRFTGKNPLQTVLMACTDHVKK